MKIVKLNKKYSIDDEGNLYKNGKIVPNKNRRVYLRIGEDVQQLAFWIAKYFVNGYFDGAVVDHIDSDPTNNHPSNLQWITQSENMKKRLDFENSLSKEIRKFYAERGVDNIKHSDIVQAIVWKKRHNGKFKFELTDEDDVCDELEDFFETKPYITKK